MALSLKQEKFIAAYLGRANGNATEAARQAGYASPNTQGPRLLVNVGIQEAIEQRRREIKAEGIANQQNRIDEQNARWELLKEVRKARADDPINQIIPEAKTGLMVKQLKKVHHRYDRDPNDPDSKPTQSTEEIWEVALDDGYLREMRELEKATATELGQIVTKSESNVTVDGPLVVTMIRHHEPPAAKGDS